MGLKNIAANLKLRVQLRKMEWPSYAVSELFSGRQKVMLLLPPAQKDTPDMKAFCSELGELFGEAAFIIISPPDNKITFQNNIPNVAEKLRPESSEMTWSGLPAKEFMEQIKNINAQLLIDLSVKKCLYNAYIAACSRAPIRIGNFGSWGKSIYNLEIKSNYLQNEQLIAKSIIDVLKAFRAGVNN